MGSREIMVGHKVIFRVIAPGAHTEADSREMDQVLEAEVDLTKVQMLADQGSLVRLSHKMPQDIIARNQATYRDSVTRRKEDECRLKRGSSNMMANIDSQFETDEGYENYDDLYQMTQVKYYETIQQEFKVSTSCTPTRSHKDKIYSSASETLFKCIRGTTSL